MVQTLTGLSSAQCLILDKLLRFSVTQFFCQLVLVYVEFSD